MKWPVRRSWKPNAWKGVVDTKKFLLFPLFFQQIADKEWTSTIDSDKQPNTAGFGVKSAFRNRTILI